MASPAFGTRGTKQCVDSEAPKASRGKEWEAKLTALIRWGG